MRYIFVLLFFSGCAFLEKETYRNSYSFNRTLSSSVHARETLNKYVENPDSFVGWDKSLPEEAKKTVMEHQNAFNFMCDRGDLEACDELKLAQEAVKSYDAKIIVEKAELQKQLEEKEKLAEEKRIEKEHQAAEYKRQSIEDEKSGSSNLGYACIGQNSIERIEKQIQYQKKIGSKYGVVDKNAMYQLGIQLNFAKKTLSDHKPVYEKKSGKKFHRSLCSQPEQEEVYLSREEMSGKICASLVLVKNYKMKLSELREIQKNTGVTNSAALYDYGSRLEGTTQILADAKAKFKKTEGVNFDTSECK